MQEERLTNIAFTYANDLLCDGAGSQLHRMYGVYALSRRWNVSYYHSPLKKIGYQGIVALQKNENSLQLLERYNQLFHLSSDVELPEKYTTVTLPLFHEQALLDLAQIFYADLLQTEGIMTNTSLASHFDLESRDTCNPAAQCSSPLSHQASQLPRHDQYEISRLMKQAKEEKNQFLLVRIPLTVPFTTRHPEVFHCLKGLSPFKKKSSLLFRIAIHVRWGDLLIGHEERLLPNEYYIAAATKAIQVLEKSDIPFVCELHTEMPTTSFLVTPQHRGMDNWIAEYRLKEPIMLTPEQYRVSDFEVIPHLRKCINEDPIKTLEALSTADLLIMSKSSFSYLAALFNQEGKSLYAPFWHPPMSEWLHYFPPFLFAEQLEEYCEEWLLKRQSRHA